MDLMGGILTKGLGAPACCGLILAQFNLARCCQYTIEVTVPQYDGGSKPLAPGEIHNFYTPVGTGGVSKNPLKGLDYLQPYNPPRPVEKITITLTTKDKTITKEYFVPKYNSKILIRVNRFIVGTAGVINVTITNFTTQLKDKINVIINKFRKIK